MEGSICGINIVDIIVALLCIILATSCITKYIFSKYFCQTEYYKGYMEGWRKCEGLVMDRAKENPDYNTKKVLEDLIV